MQLNHVLIAQNVVAADGLAVERAAAPDARRLDRVFEIAVNLHGQFRDRAADGGVNGLVMSGGLPGCFV